ncbi:hypothetical protein BAUCODRAFT_332481 [Baudoinia panamericana UAMH 10762]|uniref:Uncharacterized protein n=1 Tax=Baudoinia panamericana (strain UAMH 10762) TaxID=717646 RepID=M2M343_BAUPA|nr:uncharacterized protein BAUCODRAFT_332481 [Baudoinia panamericana UAMH 10762]EMC90956.1 hypothetical protein BAUCODRAFT_332481 [Baudoinia panamericana UAMH 10762]
MNRCSFKECDLQTASMLMVSIFASDLSGVAAGDEYMMRYVAIKKPRTGLRYEGISLRYRITRHHPIMATGMPECQVTGPVVCSWGHHTLPYGEYAPPQLRHCVSVQALRRCSSCNRPRRGCVAWLRKVLPDRAYLRCLHVLTMNQRARDG